jgi:hypothetical protein
VSEASAENEAGKVTIEPGGGHPVSLGVPGRSAHGQEEKDPQAKRQHADSRESSQPSAVWPPALRWA